MNRLMLRDDQWGGKLSTKIHVAVDALGNPVRLLLTPGQASEYGPAPALLEGFSPQAVLGYDSDALPRPRYGWRDC